MNLKLRVTSIWIPQFMVIPELDNVAEVTVGCLNQLLRRYAPENPIWREELVMKGDIKQRRRLMATSQNIRVKALIEAVGFEEALKIGRKALFNAGLKLGQDARGRLRVGDSVDDLIRAARVLYRVLGIEFHIEEKNEKIFLKVEKCALSKYYSPETCKVMSAADEGVVRGLNKNFSMNFTERITEGRSECIACINSLKKGEM